MADEIYRLGHLKKSSRTSYLTLSIVLYILAEKEKKGKGRQPYPIYVLF